MVWSINLLVLAIGFFIVGMIKPKWLLFWMDQPGRMPIIILCSVLLMVAAVMFGEASKEKQLLNSKPKQEMSSSDSTAPVVKPEPNIQAK